MKNLFFGTGIMVTILFGPLPASAAEAERAAVGTVLQELAATAPADFDQISGAIAASGLLQQQINTLHETGRFSGFSVAPRARFEGRKAELFGGFTQGTRIVLTTEFLQALRASRLFDVVYSDDILPDNTVFAVAHLLHHLRAPLDPRDHPSRAAFVEAAMRSEAEAFIQGWNAMLQAAERKNDGKPLSPRQQGQLLMNARYRFAFIGAMSGGSESLDFSPTGMLDVSERNVRVLVAALKNAAHADLE